MYKYKHCKGKGTSMQPVELYKYLLITQYTC